MNGKHAYELWAEAIRDVGILFMVFGPLDTLFKCGHGTRLDWVIAAVVFGIGLGLLAVGVKVGSES